MLYSVRHRDGKKLEAALVGFRLLCPCLRSSFLPVSRKHSEMRIPNVVLSVASAGVSSFAVSLDLHVKLTALCVFSGKASTGGCRGHWREVVVFDVVFRFSLVKG